LHRRKLRYGLATLCVGGGMGIATIVERSKWLSSGLIRDPLTLNLTRHGLRSARNDKMKTIKYELQDGIATITFDEEGSPVNTMCTQWQNDLTEVTAPGCP
jgi:hypothetical protein